MTPTTLRQMVAADVLKLRRKRSIMGARGVLHDRGRSSSTSGSPSSSTRAARPGTGLRAAFTTSTARP